MSPGRFITLEGGEGAGKSTQARALAAALEARGLHVLVTREPGGSDGAEAIRDLLMQGDIGRWSPHAETLLFAAARADHVEKRIRPAIGAGHWVICDRYVDSTRAYQGAQGIDDAAILALHGFGSRGLMPDRTFLLELPPEEGAARAAGRGAAANDRFETRGRRGGARRAGGGAAPRPTTGSRRAAPAFTPPWPRGSRESPRPSPIVSAASTPPPRRIR